MKLIFKQRFLSFFGSYDIYDETGNVAFTVKGKLSWGSMFKVYDRNHNEVGTIQGRVLSFLPRFDIYRGETFMGTITKEFTFFVSKFNIDYKGWKVDGDFMGWDYCIYDSQGYSVATVSKELLNFTDTYTIEVSPENALDVLMLVIAIDAEKASRN